MWGRNLAPILAGPKLSMRARGLSEKKVEAVCTRQKHFTIHSPFDILLR